MLYAEEIGLRMHDDDGLIPAPARESKLILRHFDKPVGIRELPHSTLDRLLNEMLTFQEPVGCVTVTSLDVEGPFAGRSVLMALDLDPQESNYEGLNEPE